MAVGDAMEQRWKNLRTIMKILYKFLQIHHNQNADLPCWEHPSPFQLRSSRPEVFCRKGVLKKNFFNNFADWGGKDSGTDLFLWVLRKF